MSNFLPKVVTEEAAKCEGDKYNIKYFEASAKIRHNIKELFLTIAKDILEHKEAQKQPEEMEASTSTQNDRKSIMVKNKKPDGKSSNCC